MIPSYAAKKRYKVEGHYDSENKIMYFDMSSAVVRMYRKTDRSAE